VAKQVGVLEVIIGTFTLLVVFAILPWQAALAAFFVTSMLTLISGLYYRLAFRASREIAWAQQISSPKLDFS
jgi:hypothetical protein